jgi:N-acetylglucosaminyldiphosphoundecaprenol N-acetyl-beta-D-mannosaminyltransferase
MLQGVAHSPSDSLAERISLLGVPIDVLSGEAAVSQIQRLLSQYQQYQVSTPNSEMLVEACSDPGFRQVLRSCALNLPDSAGLLFMARWTGQRLPARVTGTDTMQELCRVLTSEFPVFLLGAKPGIAEKAAEILKGRNPKLKIAGTYAGTPREEEARDIIARINASDACLLFVAYGAPAQELWIAKHLHSLTSVRVAMGIGGAFDFVAGAQKRAPVLLQKLGLEWLWRLVKEPKRFRRIWNAVVVFPWLVVRYGKNVSA